jgi:cation:H+ antiporter
MSSLGLFVLGLFLLLLGGDSALRAVSGLAQKFGLAPFKTGLLLMGAASSLPTLALAAYAQAAGQPDLALGSAVGASVASLGLCLGVAALIAPLSAAMRLFPLQWVSVLVACGLLLLFASLGSIAPWQGGVLLAAFVAVLAFVFQRGAREDAPVQAEVAKFAVTSTMLVQNLVRFAFAAGLLYLGSRLVVGAAPEVGASLGLNPLVLGLAVAALGGALPQLASVLMSSLNGLGNVVVGQALGVCLFNLLFVVGAMAVQGDVPAPTGVASFAPAAVMAFALALFPLSGGRLAISRRFGIGLLMAFAAWLVLLFVFGTR